MKRLAAVTALVALGSCERAPKITDDIIAVWIAPNQIAHFERAAKACGAIRTRLIEDDHSRLFVVGRDESVATRNCFGDVVAAEYKRRHPIRSRLEAIVQ